MLPSPTIAPIIYFFTNSLAVLACAAVMFFGLGVMWGWLTWARYKRRARAFQEETDLLRHEIARLKRQIAEQTVPLTLAAPVAPSEESDVELEPVLPLIFTPVPENGVDPSETKAPVEAATEVPPKQESLALAVLAASPVAFAPVALPDEVMTEAVPVPEVEAVVTADVAPASIGVASAVETQAAPGTIPDVVAPVIVAQPFDQEATASPVAEVVGPAPPSVSGVIAPLAAEQAMLPLPLPLDVPVVAASNGHPSAPASEAFALELADQQVRYDKELGFRYDARPDRWDDLTLLRGVAGTLQERLHECGIFTFKQMAYWSEDQARHIDARIHAKERVQRDRWVQQARDLHYLKYGEKLP